jgi:hypothetical protein
MTLYRPFDPSAFRSAETTDVGGSEAAKVAKPANPAAPRAHFSDFSNFSREERTNLNQPSRESAPQEWSAEDWRAFFDERAGTAEFDGGLPRALAEARAFRCCIVEWLNRQPLSSAAGRCAWCGGVEQCGDVILPFGTVDVGHIWVHAACWDAWYEQREARARDALEALGIYSQNDGG